MVKKYSFLIILFCELVIAQVPLPANGICPTFENCTDADIKNNSTNFGLAYLVSSVPYFFQADQKCTWYNFTEVSNSSILMEKYETDVETHKIRYSNGFLNKTSDRKVFLKYTDLELPMNFKVVHVTPEYWVVLACNDCGFFSKKGAGIYAYGMSRTPWPSCDVIEAINKKFEECGISKNYIKIENQDGCTKCR